MFTFPIVKKKNLACQCANSRRTSYEKSQRGFANPTLELGNAQSHMMMITI